jgi:hypothetical protein
MLYLRWGFNTLETSRQLEILGRARSIIQAKEDDPRGDSYRNAVCVLNFDGMCALYEFRPMICRLAGIPHSIGRPDGRTVESGGCVRYERDILPQHPGLKLDRTLFYRRMAEIEMDSVRAFGKRTISRTIAETLGREDPEWVLP